MSQMKIQPEFSFLTNHGKALLLIAGYPRSPAAQTSRPDSTSPSGRRSGSSPTSPRPDMWIAVREGRRNIYEVRTDMPLGLPLQRDVDIGTLLAIVVTNRRLSRPRRTPPLQCATSRIALAYLSVSGFESTPACSSTTKAVPVRSTWFSQPTALPEYRVSRTTGNPTSRAYRRSTSRFPPDGRPRRGAGGTKSRASAELSARAERARCSGSDSGCGPEL